MAMRIHWCAWQHWVSCQMPKSNESESDPSTVLQKYKKQKTKAPKSKKTQHLKTNQAHIQANRLFWV